jgi:exodeoxyribonuclease V alpha subunit
MMGVQPGEFVRCWGTWKKHLVYGSQFEVSQFKSEIPADVEGIKKYLGSGLIKGIGPSYAQKIVDHFGASTFDILDSHPEKLIDVKGLGKKKVETIINCWQEQKSIRDVMIFLQGHGVSNTYAQKIFKVYGNKSIQQLKENPYALARDIYGVGFKTADQIAKQLGIAQDSPLRIDAGIEYVLNQLTSDGHVCYPIEEFLPIASEMLMVEVRLVEERISFLEAEERIVLMPIVNGAGPRPFIWLKRLFLAETGIARELLRIGKAYCALREVAVEKAVAWVQNELKLQLAINQAEAVAKAMQDKLQVITGGPGTGKSTITRAILTISSQLTSHIVLAAPTGRAAKRMTEITGKQAKTIHSLLEWDFRVSGFKRNRQNPLEADLIIIDEASMIDTSLMYSLLKAIPDHARVIFVGDVNQLPSVGPGNVLKDMIASRTLTVSSLTEIFRQAANSRIIVSAHRINQGKVPELTATADSDFYFIDSPEPEDVLKNITTLVCERLPRKYGFDPFHDIQVLSPMKRGLFGIENLNIELQKLLNPEGTPLERMGRQFKRSDKVMQIRNNYKKEVFNGDVGIITEINTYAQHLYVDFDGHVVEYEFNELDELTLAYAVSIHKYQGSECPCIVVPVHTSHFKMLDRNLLYTAVTRGKKLVVIVGNKKAMFISVLNDEVHRRYTGLRQAMEALCIKLPI